MSRKRVIDVNPALDHLDEVARQVRVHALAHECTDPMLRPLLERSAGLGRLVDFSPGYARFRFDPLGGPPSGGRVYEYAWGRGWGYLRGTRSRIAEPASPYPDVPPPEAVTGRDLLDAVYVIEVQSVLDG